MPEHPARELIQNAKTASLGTIAESGAPYVSLVTVAATGPTTMVMLLSGLAKHTQNLLRSSNVSLLLVEPGGESGNPLEGARLSVTGKSTRVPRDDDAELRQAFLASHPESAMYADFGDFAFYRVDITEAHLVAGFGRIETLTADQL